MKAKLLLNTVKESATGFETPGSPVMEIMLSSINCCTKETLYGHANILLFLVGAFYRKSTQIFSTGFVF